MDTLLIVLIYATLPVLGHLAGVFLAEIIDPPSRVVGAALHCSAGIAFALVALEFLPRIVDHLPFILMLLMFALGVLISIALAKSVSALRSLNGGHHTAAIMVFTAVSIDLITDGFLTGAGSAIDTHLGFLLGAAQSLANIPGGFAVTATLRQHHYRKQWRIVSALLIALPVLAVAAFSLWLVSDKAPEVQNSILMTMGAVLLLTTVEDIIPEGDAPRPLRWQSSLAFGIGFLGLAALAHYF
ncbi:hypothetical protein TDB9533_00455 [Thalassocella blandensis]|nr:hypothetical protein TDB9533_00455 [Thalassocella blandensis]